MTKTYLIDPDCLQLFCYAAQYSKNVGIELLTARLIKLADDRKATLKDGSGVEMTRDEIRRALTEAWGQRPTSQEEDKLLKRILVGGGVAIGIIGAAAMFIIVTAGPQASLAILWGSGGLTAVGGVISIAAVKNMEVDINMPGDIKGKFKILNERFHEPLPNPK